MNPRAVAFALLFCLLGALLPASVSAATRAWLERDRIEAGETTTLNIETDQPDARMPDLAALVAEFSLSGHSSRRSTRVENGRRSERMLFSVVLAPRREGLVTIPSLRVGQASTQPVQLVVVPASTAPARAGAPAFIEGEADSQEPYVQQSIGYTLRLYYASPLASGQLEQPDPEGASMQRIGSDVSYERQLEGRRYSVVERRFLIVPERSGVLTIPGARFEGVSAGGFFDDVFGSGRRALRANGAPRILQVRPVPDGAPQPWLPLHGLELRYLSTPQAARAGEAGYVEVELVADGAAATQLPELELPATAGMQVFPEPPRVDEAFEQGRLRTRVTRRFAVVPAGEGPLQLAGPRQAWWDVRAGVARTATLPDIRLEVAPGNAASRSDDAVQAAFEAGRAGAPVASRRGPWPWIALAFALLWLATLGWALRRRQRSAHVSGALPADEALQATSRTSLRELRQVLMAGDLGEVDQALRGLASPPAPTLAALAESLGDAAQREALAQLMRARWADGDVAAARARLREAFTRGPVWRQAHATGDALLPPLYPDR